MRVWTIKVPTADKTGIQLDLLEKALTAKQVATVEPPRTVLR